jgi:hypothetical protein
MSLQPPVRQIGLFLKEHLKFKEEFMNRKVGSVVALVAVMDPGLACAGRFRDYFQQ